MVRPNGIARTTRIRPWNPNTQMSRMVRPRTIAVRLIGVTRIRSTTPWRISSMNPKPTKVEPNRAVITSSPGTNTLNAPPGGNPGTPDRLLSSGPNSRR
jgi:hypothetical protein